MTRAIAMEGGPGVDSDFSQSDYYPSNLDKMRDTNPLELLDETLEGELNCTFSFRTLPYPTHGLYCNSTFDTILCWPTTLAGTLSVQPCMEKLRGIYYDTSKNATRLCYENGTWSGYTDFTACNTLFQDSEKPESDGHATVYVTTTIYYIGYSLSLPALSIAIWIFLYFKDLRCLRNTIHTNLMVSYLLAGFMWILNALLQVLANTDMAACIILTISLYYYHLTNFFWMFVEGLYLYMLVVQTFSVESIKLRVYVLLGWGVPALVVLVWALVKAFVVDTTDQSAAESSRQCPWIIQQHASDWIYQAPAIIVLGINCIFLSWIMWVLITKLRSANNVETQQYRKATKALLVLIPLLGITYILVIKGPSEGVSAEIYSYVQAIMLSTQGFTVTLFYCFLNTEVQNTMRHHIERWKTSRNIAKRRSCSHSKEWSPNSKSRTESLRLCNQTPATYNKRESLTNASTATATVSVGNVTNTFVQVACKQANGSTTISTTTVGKVIPENTIPLLMKENAV